MVMWYEAFHKQFRFNLWPFQKSIYFQSGFKRDKIQFSSVRRKYDPMMPPFRPNLRWINTDSYFVLGLKYT